jgi:6-phosphogluconolactonase
MNNFELISFASADELARAAAGAWLDEIETTNCVSKTHCVALSGGRITQKFFAATVEQAGLRKIGDGGTPSLPANVHFFWADERCVPPTDPESNFKLASELLFAPLKIPATQIHRIRGEDLPEKAAKLAAAEIIRIVPIVSPSPRRGEGRGEEAVISNSKPLTPTLSPLGQGEGVRSLAVLDLIFLGMGEDGHVASLFPNAPPEILNCASPFLVIDNSPKPPPRRISLSYAAIAAAKQVWVLVSGAGKAPALRESLRPGGRTPLARVLQLRSKARIFSDFRLD